MKSGRVRESDFLVTHDDDLRRGDGHLKLRLQVRFALRTSALTWLLFRLAAGGAAAAAAAVVRRLDAAESEIVVEPLVSFPGQCLHLAVQLVQVVRVLRNMR